jgi:hypothetical protein
VERPDFAYSTKTDTFSDLPFTGEDMWVFTFFAPDSPSGFCKGIVLIIELEFPKKIYLV